MSTDTESEATGTEEVKERPKLSLTIVVASPSACERHVTVTVARADIDRYFDEAIENLAPKASVPGFRPGKAPRKLIERSFKDELKRQVKAGLLMDAISQATDEQKLAAISEPDIDVEAVEIPKEGDLTFEYNLEVRPEFAMPNWKGLAIKKPVRNFDDEDVRRHLTEVLSAHADLTPIDGPAGLGDYVTCNVTSEKDGQVVSREEEVEIVIREKLSFADGKSIDRLDKLMVGVKAGETREAKARISSDIDNEAFRGETVTVKFEVLDVKRLELPEITPEFLARLSQGGENQFQTADELRDVAKRNLERQLAYAQSRNVREQITKALTESASWTLPPDLLRRQSRRELERAIMELRSSGFGEEMIRAHLNELRNNILEYTEKALKEHFILERLAEEEKIKAEPADFEMEIALIAAQRGDNPRRVRARIEKQGTMDALTNQIIERKVINLIQQHANVTETEYVPLVNDTAAVEFYLSGRPTEEIPEAKHKESAEEVKKDKELQRQLDR